MEQNQPTVPTSPVKSNWLVMIKSLKRNILIALGILLFVTGIFTAMVVLFDSFNNVAMKALWTVISVFIYTTILLALVWDEEQDWYNEFPFFSNTLLILLIISFITTFAGIWGLIGSSEKLQLSLIVIGLGSFAGDALGKFLNKHKYINYTTIISQTLLAIMVVFVIANIYSNYLTFITEDFLNRLIAASAVLFGSSVGMTAVLYRLFVPKPVASPDMPKVKTVGGLFSGALSLLGLIIVLPFVFWIILLFVSMIY